jgi:hypothetical protein
MATSTVEEVFRTIYENPAASDRSSLEVEPAGGYTSP